MSISLVSINIEESKHLREVISFLTKSKANIVCLQELHEEDIPLLESSLGMHCTFAPNGYHIKSDSVKISMMGVGIFYKVEPEQILKNYFTGSEEAARDESSAKTEFVNFPLLVCEIKINGVLYKVANIYFRWTPDGQPSEQQEKDADSLLAELEKLGEFILVGDFNAPRMYAGLPGQIFSRFSKKYKDNIPESYKTSLDSKLHRAGNLIRMVDGLFSTASYQVYNVVLHNGVSDHCAITATVERII